ncbi:beta-adducin isoform X2 [Cynoglossus semilaevis]|uniref:beta-adducin isoform X2 n=1 Tax=Cynoglossus semilaevis TaxID=244447 RepID=UPI000D627427|nr:beta-adducin isoform X2 [Cynoglossus semilaevis]
MGSQRVFSPLSTQHQTLDHSIRNVFPAFSTVRVCCLCTTRSCDLMHSLCGNRWDQSFKEELDVLIQEQMKKGGSSSNLWALKQLADFMASHGSPAALPVSPSNMMMVMPINDLHSWEPGSLVKGERLMRCKLASTHRLFDLYGWAGISHTCLTLRVSKEQEHFLVLPDGLAYSEVTGSSLVKVNILGEVVEKGSTNLGLDPEKFGLHSAIYSARPDVRCLLHLHTPATAAVSAMKCGLLPLSHEALLVGDVAYYDYNGVMEEEEDRVELQKSLGPTCKVLVLRNHGIVALGDSVEEAFYTIYHIQAACQIQVTALCSAGGESNLILLDRTIHKPISAGTVGWAGSTFGPLQKSRVGEHEFEALMRTLDNLGYRTGYAYRFPLLLERTRMRREVEVPATVTVFHQFDDDGVHPALRQHPFAQRQQQERTRWLNTPNSYQKVNQEQASPGNQRSTWLKSAEVTQAGGTSIKIEASNQFVPLFTNPQEVVETRNKIRQQNRQDMKTAGPQSQVLASVITENSPPSPVSPLSLPSEPEPPNPFSDLTDQALEEYKKEVQRKQDGGTDGTGEEEEEEEEEQEKMVVEANEKVSPPVVSPTKVLAPPHQSPLSEEANTDSPAIQIGGEEEKQTTEELEKGMKALSTNDTSSSPAAPPVKPQGGTPEGSPSKSPSKKKKKFKPPSFLKKSKKQKEKAEA